MPVAGRGEHWAMRNVYDLCDIHRAQMRKKPGTEPHPCRRCGKGTKSEFWLCSNICGADRAQKVLARAEARAKRLHSACMWEPPYGGKATNPAFHWPQISDSVTVLLIIQQSNSQLDSCSRMVYSAGGKATNPAFHWLQMSARITALLIIQQSNSQLDRCSRIVYSAPWLLRWMNTLSSYSQKCQTRSRLSMMWYKTSLMSPSLILSRGAC